MRETLPRAPVVSGVLSGLSVLASALLLELGRSLVMNSFGESTGVQLVASGLRWLAVLIMVLAVLYTAYRLLAERRNRRRLVRRRRLLTDLDGPPLTGPVVARPDPPAPERDPLLDGDAVVAALRELPVTEYDAATLYAITTAVGTELALSPRAPAGVGAAVAGEPWTASGLRDRLVAAGVLDCYEPQRYRLARVPESPGRNEVINGTIWQAALFALLCHRADLATSWAVASTTVPFGPRARRWFTAEEPGLRQLVRVCCRSGISAAVPPATAAQLVRLGDALDTWYACCRAGTADTREVARDLAELGATRLGGAHRAIMLRAGLQPVEQRRRWRPWRWATGVGARAEHEAGRRLLCTATTPEALAAAVDRLRAAWWRLPREDAVNQVHILVDLAVAHIYQGRLDAAQDRLELAALRAVDADDSDGWARVHELAGVVCWARGEPRAALHYWQHALTTYGDLADDRGIGRCLQHLGAAVLIVPEHGDLVLGAENAHTVSGVLRHAHAWLAEARRRYPDATCAGFYLDRAATLRGVAEVPDMDRLPLEVRETSENGSS